MKSEEWVSVAVRLFALSLAIYVLTQLPGMGVYLDQNASDSSVVILFVIGFLMLVLAGALWKHPLVVARGLLPSRDMPATQEAWTVEKVLSTGFILLGIYFAFGVVSDATYWLFAALLSGREHGPAPGLRPDELAAIYATAVEFVFVVGLVFGARGLANLIMRIRYAGSGAGY